MHNELNKKKGIWGGGIGNLDFWKMILTVGSMMNSGDGKKDMTYESDDETKFTFRRMLETDPETWDTLIGYNEFANNHVIYDSSTHTLTLKNIKVIGEWMAYHFDGYNFYRCINLHEKIKHIIMNNVLLPGNRIPASAFKCTSLESIVLPEGIKAIGSDVNRYDGTTTEYLINNASDVISELCVFDMCASLVSITIPKSVEVIGYDAFAFCSSLTSIFIQGNRNPFTSIYMSSFPTEMKYIITTGNVMKNLIDKNVLNDNENVEVPENDIYHIFTVEYITYSDSRYLSAIDQSSPPVTVIATPETIKSYVTNPEATDNLTPHKLYTFTLSTVEDEEHIKHDSVIRIDFSVEYNPSSQT